MTDRHDRHFRRFGKALISTEKMLANRWAAAAYRPQAAVLERRQTKNSPLEFHVLDATKGSRRDQYAASASKGASP
jgi:hypothetical protein